MEFDVCLTNAKSHIVIEKGCVKKLKRWVSFPSKVLVITDDGVPEHLCKTVLSQIENGELLVIAQGEKNKNFDTYQKLLHYLLDKAYARDDMIIALGGGVITDLCGFIAATYKRGCRFISIPTTTLAQIDASVGGKVAVNIEDIKNCVGTFYHPEVVLIDVETLSTLPKRHYYNGLVEALKVGMIGDMSLYQLFKENKMSENIETIIQKAVWYKKTIVEADEKERDIRKILNYGHTIGHAIESFFHLEEYLHGECVANGILCMLEKEELKKEVLLILQNMNIPVLNDIEYEQCFQLIYQDKKVSGQEITIVKVDQIGEGYLKTVGVEQIKGYLKVR